MGAERVLGQHPGSRDLEPLKGQQGPRHAGERRAKRSDTTQIRGEKQTASKTLLGKARGGRGKDGRDGPGASFMSGKNPATHFKLFR